VPKMSKSEADAALKAAEEEVSRIEKELGTFKGKSSLKGQTLFGL